MICSKINEDVLDILFYMEGIKLRFFINIGVVKFDMLPKWLSINFKVRMVFKKETKKGYDRSEGDIFYFDQSSVYVIAWVAPRYLRLMTQNVNNNKLRLVDC